MRIAHGTSPGYDACGTCPACREYQRARVARNRADRLASGRLTHGKRSSYDAGCRCPDCTAARKEAYRRLPTEWWGQR